MPDTEEIARDSVVPPDVRRQAVNWLVELQSDIVTDETRDQWQKWRMSHPDHEYAWQQVEVFSRKLRGLPSPLAHAALTPPHSSSRRRAIKALTVLIFLGSGTWVAGEGRLWCWWPEDYCTGIGEHRAVTLSDGTGIELNSGSAITVNFDDTRRLIRLMNGEIMVTTAPDPRLANGIGAARPLLIETAQGILRAIGTRFTVRQFDVSQQGKSSVAVFEGAVEIQPITGRLRQLEVGQQAAFTRDGVIAVGMACEADTAWRQGMIVARDMPLIDFLAELGRHRSGWLSCDPAVAQLKVTGTYPLADIGKILAILQKTLPIDVQLFTRYWIRVGARQEDT